MPPRFIPLLGHAEYTPDEMAARARAFADEMGLRRTVRDFSDRPVPRTLIEDCLRAAGTAPSGANQQPWHFVAVSEPSVKHRIRTDNPEQAGDIRPQLEVRSCEIERQYCPEGREGSEQECLNDGRRPECRMQFPQLTERTESLIIAQR
jgi:nitroreductase